MVCSSGATGKELEVPYSGKLWWWKNVANGQKTNWQKKLWRISEIVCQQVKLWRFRQIESAPCKQTNSVNFRLLAVNWHAYNRNLSREYGTFLLSEPIWLQQRQNEDEQEDFTGLQYFKIPVEILWSCVEYCNHVRYLQYYRYVAVNFCRVKLWRIVQQFAKVFHYTVS